MAVPRHDAASYVAPKGYAERTRRESELVRARLSADAVQLLERAEAIAREEDDNHVGTEHLTLALFDARAL